MQRSEVNQKMMNIIKEYANKNENFIESDSYLVDDLGLGSMDVITMVNDLEDEFGIIIEETDLRSFIQVKDMEEYICRKMGM